MANERITENKVRGHFQSDPLFKSVKFEEQKSTNTRVAECLNNASKQGKGIGKPEFIITFPTQSMDYLIVVECKASYTPTLSKGNYAVIEDVSPEHTFIVTPSPDSWSMKNGIDVVSLDKCLQNIGELAY